MKDIPYGTYLSLAKDKSPVSEGWTTPCENWKIKMKLMNLTNYN